MLYTEQYRRAKKDSGQAGMTAGKQAGMTSLIPRPEKPSGLRGSLLKNPSTAN